MAWWTDIDVSESLLLSLLVWTWSQQVSSEDLHQSASHLRPCMRLVHKGRVCVTTDVGRSAKELRVMRSPLRNTACGYTCRSSLQLCDRHCGTQPVATPAGVICSYAIATAEHNLWLHLQEFSAVMRSPLGSTTCGYTCRSSLQFVIL